MKNITLKILIPALFGVLLTGQVHAQSAPPIAEVTPKFDILLTQDRVDICKIALGASALEMGYYMPIATHTAISCGFHVAVRCRQYRGS